ncbi:hypothetical protein GCM10009817_40460 [Terrabacter lapilli]|uniref:Helix-turn-helix protein n=1 Tax=Terrabacter lapilli TaxID=436231 RepID=A0ABP5EAY3_9MICO
MAEQRRKVVLAGVSDRQQVPEAAAAWGVSTQTLLARLSQYARDGLGGLQPGSGPPTGVHAS